MQKFRQILNHEDAVLIKIELSKALVKYTQKNTEKLVKEKNLGEEYNIELNQMLLDYQNK